MFGRDKDKKKEEEPQKSVSYVVENIGTGIKSLYEIERVKLTNVPRKDSEGNKTSTISCDKEVLEALGLPTGISYFARGRRLMITNEARSEIEKDPELDEKFRKAIGIREGEEIPIKHVHRTLISNLTFCIRGA